MPLLAALILLFAAATGLDWAWLTSQLPRPPLPSSPPSPSQALAVLVGRSAEIAAEPQLSARERNRLALRESAGTLLYWLQGRM